MHQINGAPGQIRELPKTRAEVFALTEVFFLVLGCMDFRFCIRMRHALREYFGAQELDLVSIPGGAYALCWPMSLNPLRWLLWLAHATTALHAIWVAVKKHHVQQIVLASHEHCGMVSLDGNSFDALSEKDREEERIYHEERLFQARHIVSRFVRGISNENIVVSVAFVHPDENGLIRIEAFGERPRQVQP